MKFLRPVARVTLLNLKINGDIRAKKKNWYDINVRMEIGFLKLYYI